MVKSVWIVPLTILCFVAVVSAQAPPLVIVEDSLPSFDAGVEVHLQLHARGGAAPYHWRVFAGDLPEGLSLTPEGMIAGRPAKPGAFTVTVTVEDSFRPANTINKEFKAQVTASLLFEWLHPPLVHGNKVDGAVQVSNGSKDDFDFTFIIVAINENGRATALGYQHFALKAGTVDFQIPFGQTLPPGIYTVHADGVAEVPAKNTILRRQLDTPTPLPVTQGP